MSWLEMAIIAVIMLGLVLAIWRGGQANPQGTGDLGRRVGKLSGDVQKVSGRLDHFEQELDEMKRDGATTKDVARLEERIATVRAEVNGQRDLAERTWRSVERIERMILEKGMGQ